MYVHIQYTYMYIRLLHIITHVNVCRKAPCRIEAAHCTKNTKRAPVYNEFMCFAVYLVLHNRHLPPPSPTHFTLQRVFCWCVTNLQF